VLSNYVIAEANLFFLGGRRWAINMLKLVTLGSIAFGAMSKLTRSGRSRIWPWR
jgi:alanine or glycine:cation symporter, AGCS family